MGGFSERDKGGVKTGKVYLIYKCNKYPTIYIIDPPPPKTGRGVSYLKVLKK